MPVFIVLMVKASGGHSWAAGVVFAIAGITDQIDGALARRWHVESEFGKYADPLADRLMIDSAVLLLYLDDRLPWAALVIVFGRDVLLIVGAPVRPAARVRVLRQLPRQDARPGCSTWPSAA